MMPRSQKCNKSLTGSMQSFRETKAEHTTDPKTPNKQNNKALHPTAYRSARRSASGGGPAWSFGGCAQLGSGRRSDELNSMFNNINTKFQYA